MCLMKTIKEREKRSLAQAVLWTDRNSMVVQRRSQMTSHSNGSQSKYPVSLSARLSISLCLSVSLSSSFLSQSILCNSFMVYMKFSVTIDPILLHGANVFSLDGAE